VRCAKKEDARADSTTAGSERVEVLGPEVSLELLRDAVSTAILNRLGVTWDERYGELERYRNQHGDCNVPTGWKVNPALASWVATQRTVQKTGKLSPTRKQRLDELGFIWAPHSYAWETMFTELRRYRAQHGDCNVPQGTGKLGRWVHMQRHLQTAGKLSAECIARLDELGFVWEPIDATWETRFAELRRYKDMYGDCNVPQGWAENPQLGSWVSVQCTFQKKGKLSPAHKHRSR
jgi:hypothetical protein